jgi:hypothetical protein
MPVIGGSFVECDVKESQMSGYVNAKEVAKGRVVVKEVHSLLCYLILFTAHAPRKPSK